MTASQEPGAFFETALSVLTEPVAGTTDWKQITVQFTVPNDVAAARIDLLHQISAVADEKLGGCIWLDGVRVEQIN